MRGVGVQHTPAAAEETEEASPSMEVGVEGVSAQVSQQGARREYRQKSAMVRCFKS
jgi:hypothetical protein